jgi:DinB superfamily
MSSTREGPMQAIIDSGSAARSMGLCYLAAIGSVETEETMAEVAEAQQVDPRYPVGQFKRPDAVSEDDRAAAISAIAEMPAKLSSALHGLDAKQIATPYREGGWTVQQLVHHIADSHMTAFFRLRLALTEDWPTVPGYNEKAWAMLPDSTAAPVGWSVAVVEGVHARWVTVLRSLTNEQWERGFRHAERGPMTIDLATQLYAWHSKHHVAHIARLREREGW